METLYAKKFILIKEKLSRHQICLKLVSSVCLIPNHIIRCSTVLQILTWLSCWYSLPHIEPEVSLSCPQQPLTRSYLQPGKSIHPHINFKSHYNVIKFYYSYYFCKIYRVYFAISSHILMPRIDEHTYLFVTAEQVLRCGVTRNR